MDCSLLSSSIHGIFQARVLEWVVIAFSNEHLGLISFRTDWFDLLTVQGTSQESSPAPQFKGINSLALSIFDCPALTSVHDYWKNHSTDYMDLCR